MYSFSFIQLLIAYAVCFGIQNKLLFLRNKHEFLDHMLICTYCTGFHAGWITYILWVQPDSIFNMIEYLLPLLGFSLASSGFCYAFDTLIRLMETYAPLAPQVYEQEDFEEYEEDTEDQTNVAIVYDEEEDYEENEDNQ